MTKADWMLNATVRVGGRPLCVLRMKVVRVLHQHLRSRPRSDSYVPAVLRGSSTTEH